MNTNTLVNKRKSIIEYHGNQITVFSDEFVDYMCITDIYNAFNNYSESIYSWFTSKQCLLFLKVWEIKHNPNYDLTQFSHVIDLAKTKNGLSIETYINLTKSIGIFIIEEDNSSVTYAHIDIAINYAAYLSPKFEFHLISEIQSSKKAERKKDSFELLSHEQILFLVRVKDIFKFIVNRNLISNSHKEIYSSRSGLKNPFAAFNKLRNDIVLNIEPIIIDENIRQYCVINKISQTNILLKDQINEKIDLLDCYESLIIVVWYFLQIQSEINALNFANFVVEMKKKLNKKYLE